MCPDGLPVWASAVEPGSTHDLVAAHEHALGALYAAPAHGLPTLAHSGYQGAGIGVHTPVKQPTDGRRLDIDHRTYNMLLRSLRCLGDRGFALLVGRWPGVEARHRLSEEDRCLRQSSPGIHPIRAPIPTLLRSLH